MTFADVVSIEFALRFSNSFEILQAIISFFHGRHVLPLRYVFLAAATPSSSAVLCGELPSIGYRSLSESLFFLAQKKENKGVFLSLKNANTMLTYPLSLLPIPDLIPANSSSSSLMATANYNYYYNNNSKSLKTTKTLGLSFPADSFSMRRKNRKPICVEPSFSTQKQGIWSIRFDGNPEFVAELVTANDFKDAYTIEDRTEGP
ncbi:uncharacterized protein LOC144549570 isoform X1 [Carex rostrata]